MENSLVIRYDELESSQAVLKNFNEEFEASLTKLQKLVGAKSDIARLSKDHNDMVSKEINTYHDEIDSIAETQEMANTMEDLCGSAVYQFSDFEQSTEDQAKAFFDQLGIEGEVAEPHVYKNFNEYYGSPEYEHRGYGTEAPYAPNLENVDLTNKILSDNGIQEKLDATNADTTGSCQTQTPTTTSDETEATGAKTKKGNFWTKVEAFLSLGLTEEDRQRLQNQKTWGNPDGPPSKQEPEEETPAGETPAQEPPAEETPEPTTPADGGGHDRNKNKGGKNKNNKNENKLEKLSEETETDEAEFDGTEELGIEDKIGDKLTEEIDGTESIDEITDGIDTVENPDETTNQDYGNGENLTDGTENTGDQPPETEQPVTETPEEVPQEKPAEEPVTENPPVQTPVEEQPQEEKPVEVQQPTEQPQPEPTSVAEPEPTPVVEEPEPTVEEAPPVPEVNNNVDETVSETPAEEPLPELTNVDPNLEDPDANGKPETPEQPGEEINPGTGENPGNENPGTGETPGAEENPGGNEVNTPVVEEPQPETKPDTDNSNSIIDNPAAAIPAAGGAVTAGTTAVAGKAIVDHQAANATAQTTSEGLKLESLNDNATIDNNHNESYNSSSVEPDLIKEEMESTNTEMNNLSSDNHSSNNHSTTTESSNESDESDLAGIAKEYLEDEEEGKGENFSASDVTRIE